MLILLAAFICVAPYVVLERYCSDSDQKMDDRETGAGTKAGDGTARQQHPGSRGARAARAVAASAAPAVYAQGGSAPDDGTDEDEQSDWSTKFWCDVRVTDVGMALVTLFLVVVTGGLVYTGARREIWLRTDLEAVRASADAALESVQAMKESAERQLRAYVCVASAERGRPLDGQNAPLYRVELRNDGQTPAYELTGWTAFEVRDFPLRGRIEPKASVALASATTLGPGAHYAIERSGSSDWTEEERRGLAGGTMAVYWFGRIEYQDTFKNARHTEFCYYAPGSEEAMAALRRHADGNDAT